jgi:polyferredoxin
MKKRLKRIKTSRIISQVVFFGLFVFIFVRSLDPFSIITNPFLRFDPLIFLTHLSLQLKIILPVVGVLILTFIMGRFFCGWVCPLGAVIEGLDLLLRPLRKLKTFKRWSDFLKRWFLNTPPSWFILGAVIITLFFTPPILQFFHPNVWIIRMFSLSASGIAFAGFLFLCSSISRRLWCKYICPLGALYGIAAKGSLFKLSITKCSDCKRCDTCPMEAADYSAHHVYSHQCILCFDYEYRCPVEGFHFKTRSTTGPLPDESRRRFLKAGVVAASGLVLGTVFSFFDKRVKTRLLRPPGVVNEPVFIERCLRCFQCVESCPNKIIKITGLEEGPGSLFTPHLEFQEYGCDYNCQVCQLVCPNFAIPMQSLQEKQLTKIGLASIDESLCLVYAEDTNCLVCEEFCPIPQKAIKFVEKEKSVNGEIIVLKYPVIYSTLCIGCGICEAVCPVTPKAIKVFKV